jgi:hypothetical protein
MAVSLGATCSGAPDTKPTVLAAPPGSDATSTTTTTEPPSDGVPEVDVLLLIGDSIAWELYVAAQQRTAVRGGPEVRYLLAPTPASCPNWPAEFEELIDDPATTAIVMAAGFWLEIPTEDNARSAEELVAELVAWLTPLAGDDFALPTQLVALESIDSPEADERFQVAKSLLRAAADEVGVELIDTYPGTAEDGSRACLTIDGHDYPVRGLLDVVHHCPVAPLVMSDAILDHLGVTPRPVEISDVEELATLERPDGSPLFGIVGCEPLDVETY